MDVRQGVVTDDTDPARPTVRVGGATTPTPIPNWCPGYTPADNDLVLVVVDGATRYLIGAQQ